MQNLILLDRDGNLLEYILKQRDDFIVILICELHPKITDLLAKYPHRINAILNYDNLMEIQDVQSISYDLIRKLKFAQIDIETMLHRIMLNNPLAKDIYHQHLSFFATLFKQHRIDLLISSEPDLTSPNHHIPFSLCLLLGIPCYSINGYHYSAVALGNYNYLDRQKNIPFIQGTLSANVKNIAYYKPQFSINRKRSKLKRQIKKIILKLGGEMLSQFLVSLSKLNFQQYRLGVPYSYWHKLYYFFKYKQLKRFYIAHSEHPNLEENYIYYSLHFEPEAAIIGKTLLESQLTVIKMLSKALPKGWKLYIKEHPHQFMLNNEIADYFINNLDFFKNTSLYQEIKKIQNATLVSLDIPAKTLMQNAKAVATLGGTITLEAALQNIPAILFNPLESVYSVLDNTLHIQSYEDLLHAMEKIQNNFIGDQNINIEKLNPYLADPNDLKFYPNLFRTIEKHAKTIERTGETI